MDRPSGGFGRGNSQGNGIRAQQTPTDRSQPDRQEEDWSMPTNVERREDTERCETSQVPLPDVPPPTEERLFTNWSSIDSPRERLTQCIPSARSVEPNIAAYQTEQPTIDSEDNEVLRHILSDVMTTPSAYVQLDQVGTRFVDRQTNTSEVELRPQREELRSDIKHTYCKGVQVPTSHSELSSHDTDIVGDSPTRPCVTDIKPQLDGPTSIHTRRRPVQEFICQTATMPREGHPDESESDCHDNRSHDEWRHSGRRRHYHDRGGRPPDRRNDQGRGYSRCGRPLIIENPLMIEDPLMMVDPLIMVDPLMMEDPQEMEDHQDDLEVKDHQANQDLLDQCILS